MIENTNLEYQIFLILHYFFLWNRFTSNEDREHIYHHLYLLSEKRELILEFSGRGDFIGIEKYFFNKDLKYAKYLQNGRSRNDTDAFTLNFLSKIKLIDLMLLLQEILNILSVKIQNNTSIVIPCFTQDRVSGVTTSKSIYYSFYLILKSEYINITDFITERFLNPLGAGPGQGSQSRDLDAIKLISNYFGLEEDEYLPHYSVGDHRYMIASIYLISSLASSISRIGQHLKLYLYSSSESCVYKGAYGRSSAIPLKRNLYQVDDLQNSALNIQSNVSTINVVSSSCSITNEYKIKSVYRKALQESLNYCSNSCKLIGEILTNFDFIESEIDPISFTYSIADMRCSDDQKLSMREVYANMEKLSPDQLVSEDYLKEINRFIPKLISSENITRQNKDIQTLLKRFPNDIQVAEKIKSKLDIVKVRDFLIHNSY